MPAFASEQLPCTLTSCAPSPGMASILQTLASSHRRRALDCFVRLSGAAAYLIIEHSILFAALSPAKLRRCVRAFCRSRAGLCTSARSGGDTSLYARPCGPSRRQLKQNAQPKTKSASRTDSARGRSKACRGLSRGGPQKGGGQGEGRGGPARGRSEDDASADRRCFRERHAASTTASAAAAARVAAPRAPPHESTQRRYGRIVTGRARRGRADA